MKLFSILVATSLLAQSASAQLFTEKNINNTVKLNELEVPNSPAFMLAGITPSLVETPVTPKKFVLGIAQAYQQSANTFPQNYSLEFTPYWWLNPAKRSVYTLLGLKRTSEAGKASAVTGENYFSGLKFTAISIAFLSKDLIPDTVDLTQKIFSAGLRTTLVKVHPASYYTLLATKIQAWHEMALSELESSPFQERVTRELDTAKQRKMIEEYLLTPSSTRAIVDEINEIILQKPIFAWDLAAAYLSYGINDSVWRSGRSGIWTSLSSNLPLDLGKENSINKNYLSLNLCLRYLTDSYYKNKAGNIGRENLFDLGGKIAFEFDAFSLGYEYFVRNSKAITGSLKRSVGVLNYKLADNMYINAALGKDFDLSGKLIALLGIKWGFGKEFVKLPDQ